MRWARKLAAAVAGAVVVLAGLSVAPAQAIVGGRDAAVNEAPYMASLVSANSGSPFCGGALISERFVLTSAHCLELRAPSSVQVLVGTRNPTVASPYAALYQVADVRVHPQFNSATHENDIAILMLATSARLNSGVQPVKLSQRNLSSFNEAALLIAGWGSRSYQGPASNTLQVGQVKGMSTDACLQQTPERPITATMLCTSSTAGLVDACTTDSGGPITYYDYSVNKWYLAGLISSHANCASGRPSVHTFVPPFLTWITYTTGVTP